MSNDPTLSLNDCRKKFEEWYLKYMGYPLLGLKPSSFCNRVYDANDTEYMYIGWKARNMYRDERPSEIPVVRVPAETLLAKFDSANDAGALHEDKAMLKAEVAETYGDGRRMGHSKLLVTKDGVPYADQAQGVRDFKEAWWGTLCHPQKDDIDPLAAIEAWKVWLHNTDAEKMDRDAALLHAIRDYLQHAQPEREMSALRVREEFVKRINAIPLGEENQQRGASYYNWGRAYIAVLDEILAEMNLIEGGQS